MFLTRLLLSDDPMPDIWVFKAPLIWQDSKYGHLEVPIGFRTDLASTPLHIGTNGLSRRPAGMHDALYRLMRAKGKDLADEFLRDAMLAEGASRELAEMYYLGVRTVFGDRAWAGDGRPVTVTDFDTPENYATWARPLLTAEIPPHN
jgi:hypothetical protein